MAKEKYKFKKGQVVSLDQIYTIQGIAQGDWWTHEGDELCSDNVVITRDIEIQIIVK
jgi:hypothetical protein